VFKDKLEHNSCSLDKRARLIGGIFVKKDIAGSIYYAELKVKTM
jgi:hypothetical protein